MEALNETIPPTVIGIVLGIRAMMRLSSRIRRPATSPTSPTPGPRGSLVQGA
jgi:hypothetical protein